MTRQEKQTYYQAIYPRYQQASRQEKSRILNEFCSVCGYQRKYAIRKLGRSLTTNHSGKKPGRISRYQRPDVVKVIREIWFATDQMCGKRLAVTIPEWLPHYEKMKSARHAPNLSGRPYYPHHQQH